MISEKSRNLSSSWAASCANQMLRNAVCDNAPRKPPGASTGSLIGATTSRRLTIGSGIECAIDRFPLGQGERLRAPRAVDSKLGQPGGRLHTRVPADPRQRAADLLASELKHLFDETQEFVGVGDIGAAPVAHLEDHARRLNHWPTRARPRRDGRDDF